MHIKKLCYFLKEKNSAAHIKIKLRPTDKNPEEYREIYYPLKKKKKWGNILFLKKEKTREIYLCEKVEKCGMYGVHVEKKVHNISYAKTTGCYSSTRVVHT